MVANISRLLSSSSNYLRLRHLVGHIPRRYVQEFPETRFDNSAPKDYLLVLPEKLNETDNEILRIPQPGEPETNFAALTAETCFRGLSQAICAFENYCTDVNNQVPLPYKDINELFKDVEMHLYPMDFACNILAALKMMDNNRFSHKELLELLKRYYEAREMRFKGAFRTALSQYQLDKNLTDCDKRMLKIFKVRLAKPTSNQTYDESSLFLFEKNLQTDLQVFAYNIEGANQLFAQTIDEPDILAAVSSDFDDCQDLHHKERTPLQITTGTYQRFMQVCPDRFVRQMMWQTYNKRCSPKALPKFNNYNLLQSIRVARRKIADFKGYRSHIDYRLQDTMASSRQKVMESLATINQDNLPKLIERLQELYEFAVDNRFEDPSYFGLREYDIDYWAQRYKYDILIGVNEIELRSYFPLRAVMNGLKNFFSKYMSIELNIRTDSSDRYWSQHVSQFDVSRRGQPLGTIIYDPFNRQMMRPHEMSLVRLRNRVEGANHLPAYLIGTPFKLNPATCDANLSVTEVISLLYGFGDTIQSLLHNYRYYELNTYGTLEPDVKNLIPNLFIGHLLSDHKLLQTFSDRGGSKPIDSELASRILKASAYLRPFKTWYQLYKAHLDQEANIVLADTSKLAEKIYSNYCPFERDTNNYDYCAMRDLFVGPNDGVQYADLWSRQLATLCLSQMQDANCKMDDNKAKDLYHKLLDTLFDASSLNSSEKLSALVGQRFEPSKTTLGVL